MKRRTVEGHRKEGKGRGGKGREGKGRGFENAMGLWIWGGGHAWNLCSHNSQLCGSVVGCSTTSFRAWFGVELENVIR